MKKITFPLLGIALLCTNLCIAQDSLWSSARPDGHAPISIMGDHYHKKGELMFSYRYMFMNMNDNISSSSDISSSEIFKDYVVSPEKMYMDMHMLGVMFAPSNNVTISVMGSLISNSMDLVNRKSVDFNTQSSGVSDITVSSLIKLLNKNKRSLHATVGLSIPTGDIDQRDDILAMKDAQLAYPMQLGSGTWDPSFGLTFLGQADKLSWGVQSQYKLRLGENSENYTFGNQFHTSTWGAIKISNQFSFSTSINFLTTERINGTDADLNPKAMPLFNTKNSGRSQIDLGIGSNFYIPKGSLKNLRIGVEVKAPVYQKVNGIQMNNQLIGTIGIQYSFGHH